jgi:hypothetical protein
MNYQLAATIIAGSPIIGGLLWGLTISIRLRGISELAMVLGLCVVGAVNLVGLEIHLLINHPVKTV